MIDDTAIIEEFERLTHEILNHEGSRGILAGLVYELVEILKNAAEISIDPSSEITDGKTASRDGLAISPTQAALCASEEQRTALFLRGLHDAIAGALEEKPTEPVRVLYAGSGPFAALATPLMTIFPPERVQFTIVDIHPASIDSAKSVIHRFGLERSVVEFVVADACQYTIPHDATPDVIVSETMSTALETEPQVSIMRHLLGQAPEAVIVPESVMLDAYLVDTSFEPDRIVPDGESSTKNPPPDRIPLGTVFELSAPTIRSWNPLSTERLPASRIQLTDPPKPSYRPFIFTTITTFDKHVLRTHDCNLTGIREITDIGPPTPGSTVQFHYLLGSDPRLVAEATD